MVDIFQSNLLVVRGDLVMENDSSITTDARGSVSLKRPDRRGPRLDHDTGRVDHGQRRQQFDARSSPISNMRCRRSISGRTLCFRPRAKLLLTPDARGFRIGSVLSGGNITISGNIVAESGSILNVSGASGLLDLPPALSGQILSLNGSFRGSPLVPTHVESNGGTITLRGGQELFSDATLIGDQRRTVGTRWHPQCFVRAILPSGWLDRDAARRDNVGHAVGANDSSAVLSRRVKLRSAMWFCSWTAARRRDSDILPPTASMRADSIR